MRRIAWAQAKAWLLVARAFRALGWVTARADNGTLTVEKWAERRAALATIRAIGRDADQMLARMQGRGR
jgi:hypothetical protein